jgi:hypothetical protein
MLRNEIEVVCNSKQGFVYKITIDNARRKYSLSLEFLVNDFFGSILKPTAI